MKHVIFFVFPGLEIMDFAGPLQTFAEAKAHGCNLTMAYCSWQTEIEASQEVFINRLTHFTETTPRQGDIVIIPGIEHQKYTNNALSTVPPDVFEWLRGAFREGAHLCSICSGAFILGHAGLLDGKRCTTHWSRTGELQRTFPLAQVETDCLFVYDQGLYTSAGIASGIDLSLALVEQHWGPHVTSKVARELVVYMRRNHHHSQNSVYVDYRSHVSSVIHNVQDWLISHPGKTYTIEALADRFGLSERNLTRLFKKATGITIKQYATLIVLEHAKNLMNNPNNTVESTALQCGFHDARQLRRLWIKHFGMPPSRHRP